ncbi:MAG: acyl-CoA dehydrogenase family protein [Myxococcota bacterium]|nr:acyl-CoA dehydrogenase family protein [Myxococcota bacterium]
MNFDFSEDQKLLQQTARDYLEEHSPLSVCREILESDAPYSKELWNGAAELGWLGAAIPEEYGGAGFGYLELVLIAEEIGRSLAPIPFGPTVYVATEALLAAGSDAQKQAYLTRIASGDAIGTFAFTEGPGQNDVEAVSATFKDGKLEGTKLPVLDGEAADFAIVAANSAAGLTLVLADLHGQGVTRESIESIDPARPLAKLTFDGAAAETLGAEGEGAALAATLLDRAAVLTAFEQLGAATATFESTKQFTLGRYAFGRPVASFQAIKHRLADLWCEIELARSNCFWAAWALENNDAELKLAACSARIQATTALDLASVEQIQMHGGVGYTWEYDCHLFYRRARLLAAVLGGKSAWSDRLVDRLDTAAA